MDDYGLESCSQKEKNVLHDIHESYDGNIIDRLHRLALSLRLEGLRHLKKLAAEGVLHQLKLSLRVPKQSPRYPCITDLTHCKLTHTAVCTLQQ